jgi:hypothetical protein
MYGMLASRDRISYIAFLIFWMSHIMNIALTMMHQRKVCVCVSVSAPCPCKHLHKRTQVYTHAYTNSFRMIVCYGTSI